MQAELTLSNPNVRIDILLCSRIYLHLDQETEIVSQYKGIESA